MKAESRTILSGLLWEQRDSNPRPSACKADALNQLSYAPKVVRRADVSPLTNECKCMQISKNAKHNPDIFSQMFPDRCLQANKNRLAAG